MIGAKRCGGLGRPNTPLPVRRYFVRRYWTPLVPPGTITDHLQQDTPETEFCALLQVRFSGGELGAAFEATLEDDQGTRGTVLVWHPFLFALFVAVGPVGR